MVEALWTGLVFTALLSAAVLAAVALPHMRQQARLRSRAAPRTFVAATGRAGRVHHPVARPRPAAASVVDLTDAPPEVPALRPVSAAQHDHEHDVPVSDLSVSDLSVSDAFAPDVPRHHVPVDDVPVRALPVDDVPADDVTADEVRVYDVSTFDDSTYDVPAGEESAGEESAGEESAGEESAGEESAPPARGGRPKLPALPKFSVGMGRLPRLPRLPSRPAASSRPAGREEADRPRQGSHRSAVFTGTRTLPSATEHAAESPKPTPPGSTPPGPTPQESTPPNPPPPGRAPRPPVQSTVPARAGRDPLVAWSDSVLATPSPELLDVDAADAYRDAAAHRRPRS